MEDFGSQGFKGSGLAPLCGWPIHTLQTPLGFWRMEGDGWSHPGNSWKSGEVKAFFFLPCPKEGVRHRIFGGEQLSLSKICDSPLAPLTENIPWEPSPDPWEAGICAGRAMRSRLVLQTTHPWRCSAATRASHAAQNTRIDSFCVGSWDS